ncbi:hypothetical protein [Kitasatospora aureofaciens]|uniref:hypothetical protein n=1 Tax=Kitasatospora aureofaciens TaxID=1894 RepID=UPI0037C90488
MHLTILEGKATVGVRKGAGLARIIDAFDLAGAAGQAALPPTLKLGLSASTGSATNNFDVRNLRIGLPLEITQKLRQEPYQLTWPAEYKDMVGYPYRFTLKARKADVHNWRIGFTVPVGAKLVHDAGAWYEGLHDGTDGSVEIRTKKDDKNHVVKPAAPCPST